MSGSGSVSAQTVKYLPATRDAGFDPWAGMSPWRREGPLQCSHLENSMDCSPAGGTVHGVCKSRTRLSD